MNIRQAARGFTLIELVLAIFIFSIGALGLAATTAVITRSLAATAIRERAVKMAAARIEQLRSLTCSSARSGSESSNGIVSSWAVTPSAGRLSVLESVTYTINGRSRTDAYAVLMRCQQ